MTDDPPRTNSTQSPTKTKATNLVPLILRAVTLAAGVAVSVLSALNAVDEQSAHALLGVGVACAGLSLLETAQKKDENE